MFFFTTGNIVLNSSENKLNHYGGSIKNLQGKTGITAEQVKGAVAHMLDYVKAKLPASLHGVTDNATNGKAGDFVHYAKQKTEEFMKNVTGKITSVLRDKILTVIYGVT